MRPPSTDPNAKHSPLGKRTNGNVAAPCRIVGPMPKIGSLRRRNVEPPAHRFRTRKRKSAEPFRRNCRMKRTMSKCWPPHRPPSIHSRCSCAWTMPSVCAVCRTTHDTLGGGGEKNTYFIGFIILPSHVDLGRSNACSPSWVQVPSDWIIFEIPKVWALALVALVVVVG